MATYNGEKYVEEQLKSILSQTIRPDEIVICDDCSTDKTVKVIENTLDGYNVNYLIIKNKSNLGSTISFEKSIKALDTEIIFLSDQDDWWFSEKIQRYLDIFDSNEKIKLVFSNSEVTDSKLNCKKYSLWDTLDYNGNMIIRQEIFKRNIFTGMCMAFKKELLSDQFTIPKYMLHDEFVGWCGVIENAVFPLNEKLAKYRQHSNNVVGVKNRSKFKSFSDLKMKNRMSSYKTKMKYLYLKNISDDKILNLMIDEAIGFYDYRTSLYSLKKIEALLIFFKYCCDGSYKKFSSNTDNAKLKDFISIIL